MSRILRTSLLSAVLLAAVVPTVTQAYSWSFVYRDHPEMVRPRRGTSSASAGLRKEISKAQSDLARAYAAASRADTSDEDVKAAQQELDQTRKAYTVALNNARSSLDTYPAIARLRSEVRVLEAQLNAATSDDRVRIAAQLMPLRNELNKAEWDVLGVDPDLAVAKKAIAEATDKMRLVQARRQNALQQDPAVLDARQRLASLRAQLSPRR